MREVHKKKSRSGILWMSAVFMYAMLLGACGTSNGENASVPSAKETGAPVNETLGRETFGAAETESTDVGIPREDGEPSDADAVEVNGIITKIDSQSFQVSEFFTEEMEDGLVGVGPVGVGPAEVKYTDETVFIIRSSQDMGVTHSDREGNAGDLEIGRSVTATGMRDGDVFTAEEIVIYFF